MIHNLKILSNIKIAKDTYEMVLKHNGLKASPGQFIHIKLHNEKHILRRPISITHMDEETLTILYKVVGEGTLEMSYYGALEYLEILGPLGHGFPVEFLEDQRVTLVGGGIGVAPLYELAVVLHQMGYPLTIVLGFRTEEEIYYYSKFKELGEVVITTDDGSFGIQGHVGVALDTLTQPEVVYACGPLPLIYHVQQRYQDLEHVYVSLEERMACGMGACHGCDTKDKKYRVCYDGPVFNAKEIQI